MFIRSGCRLPAPDPFPLKPMKHFSFFLTLLLLTACTRDPESGPAPGVGQTPMREFYIPGVFRIKLRETAAELDTRAFTRQRFRLGNRCIRCRRHPVPGQLPYSVSFPMATVSANAAAGPDFICGTTFISPGRFLSPRPMERFGRVDEVEWHRTCSAYGSRRGDGLAS